MLRSLTNSIRTLPRTIASRSISTTPSTLQNPPPSLNPNRPPTTTPKMAPIERITLFKVPKEEDRLRLLEQYKVLAKTATKVSQRVIHLENNAQ